MKRYIWTAVFIAIIGGIIFWARSDESSTALQPAQALNETSEESVALPENNPKENGKEESITSNNTTTQNGMTIEIITEGTGVEIKNGQTAVVQYEGTLTDGSVFDSTAKHGGTAFEFPLGAGMVIKGWDQGVLGMKVGETRKLTIPPELGYGERGFPPVIPQNATLIFTVTLEAIK